MQHTHLSYCIGSLYVHSSLECNEMGTFLTELQSSNRRPCREPQTFSIPYAPPRVATWSSDVSVSLLRLKQAHRLAKLNVHPDVCGSAHPLFGFPYHAALG